MKKTLVEKAFEVREKAYTPYSHHKVGAALLGKNGQIYLGCNIENAAFTPSNCAERTAVFKAVSEGQLEFDAIAVVGGMEDAEELDYCAPCGVCRQVLREFCDNDFEIILAKDVEHRKTLTLKEILPLGFGPENLR
ncbi:MAG TPA: cytidine deaminase [Lachnospiraceae bacterium]|nr:cytidine deaminase [Lachnospiraceae bacterium]HAN51414.1 cytidine deaminase [Lachnospiraceae bacterium]HBE08371.1 cytidine deaminase [Lachnospiraceae bacterium]